MYRLLHISDLHFGPAYLPHVGEALMRMIPDLRADVIVISGDFTQRAKVEQFEEAAAYLARLPDVPVIKVPGNHDIPLYRVWERFTAPHELYRKYISEELDTVTRMDGLTIVALDSSAPRMAVTNGRISPEQIEYCARAFAHTEENDLRVVVAHHHLAPAPDYKREQVLPDARDILERFIQMRVDLVLGGHLHRAYIGNSLDVHPGVARDRGTIIVQCGTTTSRRGRAREREKNTFNLLELDREMVRVTHYMYFEEEESFGPMSRHIFPRPGRRFVEAALDVSPPPPTEPI